MEKYSLPMRIMHWLVGTFIIILLAVGLYMTDLPSSPERSQIYGMHKAFGITVFALVLIRLGIRMRSKVPALPEAINKFDAKLAAFTVLVLYVAMLLMPISGYLMSTFYGYEVKVFFFTLPKLVSENKSLAHVFKDVHEATAYTMILLIALHIAGTIKHIVKQKINLVKRMI